MTSTQPPPTPLFRQPGDVAHHHRRGRALGARHITGDLTGLFRVKFDLPATRPERYRLIYSHEDDAIVIWALGLREDARVYRDAATRDRARRT
jgi:hypothetical protein